MLRSLILMGALALAAFSCHAASTSASPSAAALPSTVRLKDIARIEGIRENSLVGYGIVAGLAGTGDTGRNRSTLQSISNALARLGVRVSADQISSRNVAAVLITATLPAFANAGDKIDANVSSLGDARSLLGGTLIMAPLIGADDQVYAVAQGSVSLGGFRYDALGNVIQKNHPTVGQISGGAIVERTPASKLVSPAGTLYVLLSNPDFTTASRVAASIATELPPLSDPAVQRVQAVDAERVAVRLSSGDQAQLVETIRKIENLAIVPDQIARVVVNERTGSIVSGGDALIAAVSVVQGDLTISITTDYLTSQPIFIGSPGPSVRSLVVPDTEIKVQERQLPTLSMAAGTSVSHLVDELTKLKTAPREIISILQAIRRAGALQAHLVIQ